MDIDLTGFFVFLAVVSAIVGWALIEGVLWLFSHLTFGWV